MKEIKKLIELINLWDKFLMNNYPDINNFAKWILKEDTNNTTLNFNNKKIINIEDLTDKYSENFQFLSALLIFRLSKFIKIYTKELLHNSNLSSIDEFSFLAMIDQMKNPSKKDLCKINLTEFTTGMDIIKRLENKGYAEEITDKNDKRTKRMKITNIGKEILNSTYNKLRNLNIDILGNLNQDERQIIIKLLKSLDLYHTEFLKNKFIFDSNK